MISTVTFAEAYRQILHELYYSPEYECAPHGQNIREITNLIVIIQNPCSNMFNNVIRSTPKKYLAGELYWYFSGRNDVETIRKYSKFWDKIINPDGKTVNSAYGHLLFKETYNGISEWQWALNSLIKDKDSRQAIIRFNKPWHSWWGNKDFVCTLTGIFNIRANKLNFTIIMRSQDEIFGRTFDLPFFTLLQQQMLKHLQPTYPNLSIGIYMQHNISSHIYERDFNKIKKMLEHSFYSDCLPPLDEDLIWQDGKFNLHNFSKKGDSLIDWIKYHMEDHNEI